MKRVKEETGGQGADVAVEVIGKIETVEAALQSSAYGGRVVIMGTCRPEALAKFSPFDVMRYEKGHTWNPHPSRKLQARH